MSKIFLASRGVWYSSIVLANRCRLAFMLGIGKEEHGILHIPYPRVESSMVWVA